MTEETINFIPLIFVLGAIIFFIWMIYMVHVISNKRESAKLKKQGRTFEDRNF